jgi:hypothetical protein
LIWKGSTHQIGHRVRILLYLDGGTSEKGHMDELGIFYAVGNVSSGLG